MTIINNCDNCLYLGGQDVNTAKIMAEKMNRPANAILTLPLNAAYLFTRGQPAKQVQKYDLHSHERYRFLHEDELEDEMCADF